MAIGDATTNLDPMTLVYNSIWTMLEAHDAIREAVRPGNRIMFTHPNETDGTDTMKPEVMAGDLPEIRLIPISVKPHLQNTSNSSRLTLRLQIEVATGSTRADQWLFPLTWEIFRAMQTWTTHVKTLLWNNATFVILARPMETVLFNTGSPVDLIRGITGWTAVWAVEVDMHMATADLTSAEY